MERATARSDERARLRADCAHCAALCCVAPAFAASADFAIDKPAATPCPNLLTDFRCGIHDALPERGFPGCVAFDCFGAGQHITQDVFGGRDRRGDPGIAGSMFALLPVVRQLHELLWYLGEATERDAARRAEIERLRTDVEELTRRDPTDLATLDVGPHRARVGALLQQVSERVRAGHRGPDRRGADLAGARLQRADLRGASLRGALLIGADLRGADLRTADLLGADVRAADLAGADLTGALFVTKTQLDSARGDGRTRLPDHLARPAHWLRGTGRPGSGKPRSGPHRS